MLLGFCCCCCCCCCCEDRIFQKFTILSVSVLYISLIAIEVAYVIVESVLLMAIKTASAGHTENCQTVLIARHPHHCTRLSDISS